MTPCPSSGTVVLVREARGKGKNVNMTNSAGLSNNQGRFEVKARNLAGKLFVWDTHNDIEVAIESARWLASLDRCQSAWVIETEVEEIRWSSTWPGKVGA